MARTDRSARQPGRGWSTFGFAIGVAASIAANVAHSYVHPDNALPGWAPQPGAIVAAAFWPVALVISIEVISRVQWPHRWYWALIRYVGLSAVALIAAVISYGHLSALMSSYGEDALSSTIGPLAVDGLMVVCSGALLAIGDNVRRKAEATARQSQGEPVIAPNVNTINTEPLADQASESRHDTSELEPSKAAKPRAPRSDSARDRVLKTAARMKDPTPARIAVSTKLAEATVRKHLRTANPTTGTSEPDSAGVQLDGNNEPVAEPINGHSFADASI